MRPWVDVVTDGAGGGQQKQQDGHSHHLKFNSGEEQKNIYVNSHVNCEYEDYAYKW